MRRSTVKRPRSALRMRGEVFRGDPGAPVRGTHGQTLPVDRLNDLGSKDGFELLRLRVLVPEASVQVSPPAHHIQF